MARRKTPRANRLDVRWALANGWRFVRYEGRGGHMRFEHEETGAQHSMCCTPGDTRSERNSITAMKIAVRRRRQE